MDKVIIPLIRKVYPAMLADQIISIQPMSLDVNSMYPFTFKVVKGQTTADKNNWHTDYDRFNEYPYSATDTLWYPWTEADKDREMDVWCAASFNGGSWHRTGQTYRFKNEEDRTLFILRWAE